MKLCQCGKEKAHRKQRCVMCATIRTKERRKAWREANRHRMNESSRKYKRTRKYGISVEDFDRMVNAQGNVCAICRGTHADGRRLQIDHCHASGRVRGLLCQRCNNALGCFDDSIERLAAAIAYLQAGQVGRAA